MPSQLEAKKDVVSYEKLWGAANERRSADIRMGKPAERHPGDRRRSWGSETS